MSEVFHYPFYFHHANEKHRKKINNLTANFALFVLPVCLCVVVRMFFDQHL